MSVFPHRRKPRVLLVPNHWSGSVQEFYHFLLGYLGPIMVWVARHPDKQIAVRDCGPMNAWLDAFLDDVDMQVFNPGAMLHLFAGKVHKSAVLAGFDDPERFRTESLREFRALALDKVQSASRANESLVPRNDTSTHEQTITVIDRASSGEFNSTPAAEVPASGAAVRSIPNLREAIAEAGLADRAAIVDSAHLDPFDQVRMFEKTSILIGQHGAGLANILWMNPGSTVIEVLPPSPPWVEPIFTNLARALGHRILLVPQADPHAPVDVDLLNTAIQSVLTDAL